MSIDYSEIENEVVGYSPRIRPEDDGRNIFYLEQLVFKDFITLFLEGVDTHQELYDKLQQTLEEEIQRENSYLGRPLLGGELAIAALIRENIRDSMQLIKDHYL